MKRVTTNKPFTRSVGSEGERLAPAPPPPEILLGTAADLNPVILIGVQVRQEHRPQAQTGEGTLDTHEEDICVTAWDIGEVARAMQTYACVLVGSDVVGR